MNKQIRETTDASLILWAQKGMILRPPDYESGNLESNPSFHKKMYARNL